MTDDLKSKTVEELRETAIYGVANGTAKEASINELARRLEEAQQRSEAKDAEVAAKALEERAEYYESGDRPEWVAEVCCSIALNLREKAAEYRAKAGRKDETL